MIKICPKCSIGKSLETDFHKCRTQSNGYHSHCKQCRKQELADYREKNRGRLRANARTYGKLRYYTEDGFKEKVKLRYYKRQGSGGLPLKAACEIFKASKSDLLKLVLDGRVKMYLDTKDLQQIYTL